MGGSLLKVLNVVFGGVFLLGALVQYNDPDPWRWVAIYLAAAAACFCFDRFARAWVLAAVIGAIALVWSLTLTGVIGDVGVGELFQPMEPQGGPIETGRELGGLWIIAAWMAVLLAVAARERRERLR